MNLTEDEAKTKWCPMVRAPQAVPYTDGTVRCVPANKDDAGAIWERHLCIGSACMMWRQAQKRNPDWKPRHAMIAGFPEHPDDLQPTHIPDPTRGHCGLAGNGGLFG